MKINPIVLCLLFPTTIFSQNLGKLKINTELVEKSDVIIKAKIIKIQETAFEKETSGFPQKKAIIEIEKIVKGAGIIPNYFFYIDKKGKCAYALIRIENHINDEIILFGKLNKGRMFQVEVFNEELRKVEKQLRKLM